MSNLNVLENREFSTNSIKKASIFLALASALGINQASAKEQKQAEDYYPAQVREIFEDGIEECQDGEYFLSNDERGIEPNDEDNNDKTDSFFK